MINHLIKSAALAAVATVSVVAVATPASATTILQFNETRPSVAVVHATNSGMSTTIKATGASVVVSTDAGTEFGYLTFSTSSIGGVTLVSGVDSSGHATNQYQQAYGNGTFMITANQDGTGEDYLSGTFDAVTFGWDTTANIGASQPSQNMTFASTFFTSDQISGMLALSWSLTTTSSLGTLGTVNTANSTLKAFDASIAGTFSATAVPEPASWAMMVAGFGALGAAMRRRKPVTAVSFG